MGLYGLGPQGVKKGHQSKVLKRYCSLSCRILSYSIPSDFTHRQSDELLKIIDLRYLRHVCHLVLPSVNGNLLPRTVFLIDKFLIHPRALFWHQELKHRKLFRQHPIHFNFNRRGSALFLSGAISKFSISGVSAKRW